MQTESQKIPHSESYKNLLGGASYVTNKIVHNAFGQTSY